jgi:hypothetical protein
VETLIVKKGKYNWHKVGINFPYCRDGGLLGDPRRKGFEGRGFSFCFEGLGCWVFYFYNGVNRHCSGSDEGPPKTRALLIGMNNLTIRRKFGETGGIAGQYRLFPKGLKLGQGSS